MKNIWFLILIFVYLQRSVVATKENIFHFKSIVSKAHYLESDGFFYFMETEIWKDIIGYEGLYQISNFGNVKSFSRPGTQTKPNSFRILKFCFDKDNYKTVCLCKKNKKSTKRVHKLVANAFLIKYLETHFIVNHIDSDISNNNVKNLEFVSIQENVCHGTSKRKDFVGITRVSKLSNRFMARTTIDKKRLYLGAFDTKEDAYKAKKDFEISNGVINKY